MLHGVSSRDVTFGTDRAPIARPSDGKYPAFGEVLPAVVVAVNGTLVNLQVLFNGSGGFWAQNVPLGASTTGAPGTYWPRV